MIFHILGVSHSKTHKDYSADAFSQKARLICKMLTQAGHTVYHYGTEGSNPVCSENVNVLSKETFDRVHNYDWKDGAFNTDTNNDAHREFTENAIREINLRSTPGDFLLVTFGYSHKAIADATKCIVVESGIGYEFSFAPHRVFESYPWMNYIYGKEGKMLTPSFYDAVIPNYYDLADYPDKVATADDYYFFIARPTALKGLHIAQKCVEAVGGKLVVAGQGKPAFESPCMEFVGVVSIEQRRSWMRRAIATFAPTYYIEPFGGTVIESLLCGAPVITTDMGAFSDTVEHGKVGYRCRTMSQFHWATENIGKIDREECMHYARDNYRMERVYGMYEEYFSTLQELRTKDGWYYKGKREHLDWLNRY